MIKEIGWNSSSARSPRKPAPRGKTLWEMSKFVMWLGVNAAVNLGLPGRVDPTTDVDEVVPEARAMQQTLHGGARVAGIRDNRRADDDASRSAMLSERSRGKTKGVALDASAKPEDDYSLPTILDATAVVEEQSQRNWNGQRIDCTNCPK